MQFTENRQKLHADSNLSTEKPIQTVCDRDGSWEEGERCWSQDAAD